MENEFKRLWKNEVIGGQKVTTVRVKILPKIVDERIILQDNIVLIHDGITSKKMKSIRINTYVLTSTGIVENANYVDKLPITHLYLRLYITQKFEFSNKFIASIPKEVRRFVVEALNDYFKIDEKFDREYFTKYLSNYLKRRTDIDAYQMFRAINTGDVLKVESLIKNLPLEYQVIVLRMLAHKLDDLISNLKNV